MGAVSVTTYTNFIEGTFLPDFNSKNPNQKAAKYFNAFRTNALSQEFS